LSNYHDPSVVSVVNRKQKDGSSTAVTCPQMAKDYNNHMGCVDKADMLKSYYEISRKSKKWWHRIFWHFVDVNSYIIYNQLFPTHTMLLKDFRLAIVDHLVGFSNRPKRGRPASTSPLKKYKSKVSDTIRTTQTFHFPAVQDTRRRCVYCSTKAQEKRTSFYCKTCEVPLCISKGQNCFEKYHQAS